MQPFAQAPASADRPTSSDTPIRGILLGLMPLARLILVVAFAVLLTLLVRAVTTSQDFAVQQAAAVITLAGGLAIAAFIYAISLVGVYRRMAGLRAARLDAQASAALWTLAVTALIVILPVVVAALLPQHPAPTLPPVAH
jgi:hypothetical protein